MNRKADISKASVGERQFQTLDISQNCLKHHIIVPLEDRKRRRLFEERTCHKWRQEKTYFAVGNIPRLLYGNISVRNSAHDFGTY